MGLVAQILNFFSFYSLSTVHNNQYQSLNDCINYLKGRDIDIQLRRLISIIKKFEHEGFILKIGQKGTDPIYDSTYLAQNIYTRYLEYGAYDFYYWGFVSIRNHFLESVIPIDVEKRNGSRDIGTCFVIDGHRLLTARHCIEGMNNIQIFDPLNHLATPSTIWVPSNDMDIALIEINNYNFSQVPKFEIEYGRVLDEVLTMGYPPIPGFDAINVSDLAYVNATLKVSEGRIIAEDRVLFDRDNYFLINAKVKGGNSGGPIINDLGYVIGMIVNIPLDAEDQSRIDHLAYGVAVTGTQINNFLSNIYRQNDKVRKLSFINNKKGFSTE
ncbi:MAG: serine protease [Bacteroidota bacterium]|nr:serine protease [Bacteroidota bacterium]